MLWPGMEDYLRETLNGFETASDTQMQRQKFCFYATLPTILLPLLALFLVGVLLGLVIPAVVDIIRSVFYVFQATPAAEAVPGLGGYDWYSDTVDRAGGDAPPLVLDEVDPIDSSIMSSTYGFTERTKKKASPAFMTKVSSLSSHYLEDWLFPKGKEKKE